MSFDSTRRQGASIILYLVFGVLIAMFVINFGAQSVGTSQGCTSSASESVGSIDGHDIPITAWRWTGNYLSTLLRVPKDQRLELALEWVIQREILAGEAESRGMNISDALIDDNLKAGRLYFGGQQVDGKRYYFDEAGYFNYDALKQLAQNLGLSIGGFKEQQRRETLAAMMSQILLGEARASKDEALTRFIFDNTKVSVDVVSFSPDSYAAALQIGDADVARWLEMHDADAKAQYDKDKKQLYTGRKPELHVYEIFIPKPAAPEPAPAPAPAGSGSGSGSGSAAAPAPAPAPAPVVKDDGAEKLAAARAAIKAGKQTFAEAAKLLDGDEEQRKLGGDLGWRTVEALSLGDPKVDEVVRGLKAGDVSDVINTDEGHYLVTVTDKREGDLSYDKVKREIAETLARKAWGDEAAKRAALAALDAASKGKKLEDLFPRGESPQDRLRRQQEIQKNQQERDFEKQVHDQAAPPPKSGQIEFESKDVPADWTADDTTPPAGGVAPAAPAAPPAPPAPVDIKATTEPLPPSTEVKPEVVAFTDLKRTGGALGFQPTPEITTALFDVLGDGEVAKKVYLLDGQYAVVQLLKKNMAQVDVFEKTADTAVADLARERGIRLMSTWLHDRCHALVKAGKLKYQESLVTHYDQQGKALPLTYRPCQSLDADDDIPPAE